MSKNISGTWVDAGNNPIANGRAFFKLSQDAVVSGTTQVAPRLVAFQLDINGRLSGSIWANDELTPSGTTYLVSVVDSSNALVYGQESFSLVGASPININSLVPTTIGVSLPNPVIQNPASQQTINSFDLVMENAALGFSPSNSSTGDIFLNRQSSGIAGLGTSDVNTSGTLQVSTIQKATLNGASSGNTVTLLNVQGMGGALTGNSADQTMFTYTLPANTMAAGKGVRVKWWAKHTSGNAAVTYKTFFGASSFQSNADSAAGNQQNYVESNIFNNSGVTNAQSIAFLFTIGNTNNVIASFAANTDNADTTTNVVIKATFNVANTDQVTPGFWIVELVQ